MARNILHMLRDCPNSHLVWDHLLTHFCKSQFFTAGYQAWVIKNSDQSHTSNFQDGISWAQYFLATIWSIWKERNASCFDATPFVVAKVLSQARMLAWDMQLTVESFNGLSLDPVNGRWFPSPPGYYKLNIDGSVRDGKATYGGLLRNAVGEWVWGFNGYCGFTSPLFAELKALEQGLWLLHQRDCMRVIIESDSSEAVRLVNGHPDSDHPFISLILECKRLHHRIWSSSVTYVPRNYNYTADSIAKLGHIVCSQLGTILYNTPPPVVMSELRKHSVA